MKLLTLSLDPAMLVEIISDRCHCGHIHGDHADGQNECCHGCGCRQFVSESDSKPEAQNAQTR